MILSNNYDELN